MSIRVGVLRGGPSNEYEISMKTGASVLHHLPHEKYSGVDIFIDRSGGWHINGLPLSPYQALQRVDVVFNALHGRYGEDGEVQRILENYSMPYTGSGPFSAAVAMHKGKAKEVFARHGIRTPHHVVLGVADDLDARLVALFRTMPLPLVIKPVNAGSSIGVSIVHGFEHLLDAVCGAFQHASQVLVEECIRGKEATCAVMEHFRGHEHYVLLPVEIVVPASSPFFDYDAKYAGASQEIVPGRFSQWESQQIQDAALAAHTALGMRHYSRTDVIVTPRGAYVLETNALPGLTEQSLLPKSLTAVGVTMPQFLDHVLGLALERR